MKVGWYNKVGKKLKNELIMVSREREIRWEWWGREDKKGQRWDS